MRRVVPWFGWIVFAALIGCNPGTSVRPDGGRDAGGETGDADGDTISDVDEGRRDERDSDGDGTPDYLDEDSDGDGIPDAIEAGDDRLDTPPRDSDSDGTADYLDDDSDDNGILDRDERVGDIDGDRIDNFADLDDDNDTLRDVQELAGMVAAPVDTDGDGFADFQDRDSDGDTIFDGHERDADTDSDMTPDIRDLDSDGDGWTDAQEAGDTDIDTLPVDSDGDLVADFRDPDSDNDGLSDADERVHRTNPRTGDTDDDGVSDLIEVGAGTDPMNGADSPRTRGDFVFVVPYEEAPDPSRDTLRFRTSIQFADVYFLFDISGSMAGEIGALRTAVGTIIGNLTCATSGAVCTRDSECASGEVCSPFSGTCIEDPSTSSCVASPWTGAGFYESTLENRISLQPDPMVTSTGMASWTTYGGTERLFFALEATGRGMASGFTSNGCTGPRPGFRGCPGFREEAVRILVAFTDEDSDGGTLAGATSALVENGITLIGVWSGTAGASTRNNLRDAVIMSNSVDRLGAPLFFEGSDASVVPLVTNAINEVVEGVPLRVTIDAIDELGDAGDALQYIEALATNTTGDGCSAVTTADVDENGVHETFPAVTPGTPVCWDVIPRMNTFVMPTALPQVFQARLTVYGDGSPLDSRRVFFLVPPRIELPGGPG
jgi:hypothetical protein